MRIHKKVFSVLIALFFLFLLGKTAASRTQELWVGNEYRLGKYDTKIVEEFQSPANWKPGLSVNKDVRAENEGTIPALVKAQVLINWKHSGADSASRTIYTPFSSRDIYDLTFDSDGSGTPEYAALISWGDDVVLLSCGQTAVPSLDLGLPVVDRVEDAAGKWLLLNDTPGPNGCFTFYYFGILQPVTQTPLLVDSVRMNPKIKAGILESHTKYTKRDDVWAVEQEYVVNPASSYENARFYLTVSVSTVQAASGAIQENFTSDRTTEQSVITYLAAMAIDLSTVSGTGAVTAIKKLYLDEADGTMLFTPERNRGSHWFMSFTNMAPGGRYTDELTIENLSKKNYDLYMQVVPRDVQTSFQDDLLELISMKVFYGDELIYDGTASGREYTDGAQSLINAVFLGNYTPNINTEIRVELELSGDTPPAYCDQLAMIDWKFAATERFAPAQEVSRTGEDTELTENLVLLSIAMTIIGLVTCIFLLIIRRRRKEENGNEVS